MNYTLVTTQHFERRAGKFLRKHPDLKTAVKETFIALQQDPFQPSLKLHGLGGKLAGIQSVSITYGYRMTLTLRVTEREIILLDIGSHDELYR
jgi:mRNA-degrading endonuclease YafQ of YafQ-DinJ toxin-antitoxin module